MYYTLQLDSAENCNEPTAKKKKREKKNQVETIIIVSMLAIDYCFNIVT